jgi:DNA invertase Pin-like site-specific DNA recombinase
MKKVCIYGRVSTSQQNISTQLQVLREVANKNGWVVVKEYLDDGISGAHGRDKRPAYNQMLEDNNRKKFDGILVWSLDRLGRSLSDLVSFLNDIHSKDTGLYSHQQAIDTSTPTGKMMFHLLSVFSEYEREMIRSRVREGLDRAKREGTKSGKAIGRPSNVNEGTKAAVIELRNTGMSLNKICKTLSIGSGTCSRLLQEAA